MYFKYGSFRHDENDVDIIRVHSQRFMSPRNTAVFDRKTLHCQGRLCVTGQAAIRARIEYLEAAYKQDHMGDVGLYHDDGSASAHVLSDNNSINGVRVVEYEFPKDGGAEYATYRSYKLTFQADYLNYEDTIAAFEESLEFRGNGGPSWELVPTFALAPLLHINALYTPQRIIQKGMAMGVQGWPILPGPLYPPNLEHHDRRVVEPHSPRMIGKNRKLYYPITWRYEFSTAVPFDSGYPRQDYPGR